MPKFTVEHTYLIPTGEVGGFLSRMLISGWKDLSHSILAVRHYWRQGERIVGLSGIKMPSPAPYAVYPEGVVGGGHLLSQHLGPIPKLKTSIEDEPAWRFTLQIQSNTEAIELIDGLNVYETWRRVQNLDAAVTLQTALDAVGTRLPPVTFLGAVYYKPEAFTGVHQHRDLRVGLYHVPELGTVVQIATVKVMTENPVELLEEARNVTAIARDELLLPFEWKVTRPLALLLEEQGVQWGILYESDQDFGIPEYNVGEYYAEDE